MRVRHILFFIFLFVCGIVLAVEYPMLTGQNAYDATSLPRGIELYRQVDVRYSAASGLVVNNDLSILSTNSILYEDSSHYVFKHVTTDTGMYWDTTPNNMEFHFEGNTVWSLDFDDGVMKVYEPASGDWFSMYRDATDANFDQSPWGRYIFRGPGAGATWIVLEDHGNYPDEYGLIAMNSGISIYHYDGGTVPSGKMHLQHYAGDIECFLGVTVGVAPTIMQYGWYAGEAGRDYLRTTVCYDAANRVSFYGIEEYKFHGDMIVTGSIDLGVALTSLWDADGDTGVQVEEGADDDTFRVDTEGVERMTIANTAGGGDVALFGATTVNAGAAGGGLVAGSYDLSVLSADGSQEFGVQHDNSNTQFYTSAGDFIFNGNLDLTGTLPWADVSKSGSVLGDIANVSEAGMAANKILGTDGSNWGTSWPYFLTASDGVPSNALVVDAVGGVTINGALTLGTPLDHGGLSGLGDDDHAQYVLHTEVDDTPVDGVTTDPISSNWAYDHDAASGAHHAQAHAVTGADHTTLAEGNIIVGDAGANPTSFAVGSTYQILEVRPSGLGWVYPFRMTASDGTPDNALMVDAVGDVTINGNLDLVGGTLAWADVSKSGSVLGDVANVSEAGMAAGKTLGTTDGTNWVASWPYRLTASDGSPTALSADAAGDLTAVGEVLAGNVRVGLGDAYNYIVGNDSFSSHLGSAAEDLYGTVSGFAIKFAVDTTAGRGFTWGTNAVATFSIRADNGDWQSAGDGDVQGDFEASSNGFRVNQYGLGFSVDARSGFPIDFGAGNATCDGTTWADGSNPAVKKNIRDFPTSRAWDALSTMGVYSFKYRRPDPLLGYWIDLNMSSATRSLSRQINRIEAQVGDGLSTYSLAGWYRHSNRFLDTTKPRRRIGYLTTDVPRYLTDGETLSGLEMAAFNTAALQVAQERILALEAAVALLIQRVEALEGQ